MEDSSQAIPPPTEAGRKGKRYHVVWKNYHVICIRKNSGKASMQWLYGVSIIFELPLLLRVLLYALLNFLINFETMNCARMMTEFI